MPNIESIYCQYGTLIRLTCMDMCNRYEVDTISSQSMTAMKIGVPPLQKWSSGTMGYNIMQMNMIPTSLPDTRRG